MPPDTDEDGPLSGVGDWVLAAALVATGFLSGFGGRLLDLSPEDQNRLLVTVVGVLCLFAAYLVFQVRRQNRRMRAVEELLADVRFGPGTKRDRDAVDILVRALRVSDAGARETALRTLKKLSGLDLGDAPGPWEEWWSVARGTFVRQGAAPRAESAPKK